MLRPRSHKFVFQVALLLSCSLWFATTLASSSTHPVLKLEATKSKKATPENPIPESNAQNLKSAVMTFDRFLSEHAGYSLWDRAGSPVQRAEIYSQKRNDFYFVTGTEAASAQTAINIRYSISGDQVTAYFYAYDVRPGFANKVAITKSQVTINPKNDPKDALLQVRSAVESLASQIVAYAKKETPNRKVASTACTGESITYPVIGLFAVSFLSGETIEAKNHSNRRPSASGSQNSQEALNDFVEGLSTVSWSGRLEAALGQILIGAQQGISQTANSCHS